MDEFDLRQWPGFFEAGGDVSCPAIIKQISLDSRGIDSPESLFIALKGSKQDGHQFVDIAAQAGARYALVEKDWIPPSELRQMVLLRVKDPLQAFQEIAMTYRQQLKAIVLGITGSFGKTMLKDLLQAILSPTKRTTVSPESFNSQVGVPLSLLTIQKEDEIAIIEAGISQKNEMDNLSRMIAPNCTIITTIGNAHLTTLQNLETVAYEKSKLIWQTPNQQWHLIPENEYLKPLENHFKDNFYYWNRNDPSLPYAEALKGSSGDVLPYRIQFPDGREYFGKITSGFSYFLDLIHIAVKAAWLLGIKSDAIAKALEHYNPDPMRKEIWKSPSGTTFINDTYCSDPQSVEIALRQLEQSFIL